MSTSTAIGPSLRTALTALSEEDAAKFALTLTEDEADALSHDWLVWGRDDQQLPSMVKPWTYWLILAGRGWGKTRTGAESVRDWIRQGYNYVNIIGATADDARDVMIDGESGILAVTPKAERPAYLGSQRKLRWPNGATSLIFTADEPNRLRGKQHMKLWADELAAWRYPDAWDQAKLGLRLGDSPQAIVTTTPRPTTIIKEIAGDPDTFITKGTTYDNRDNLAKAFFSSVIKMYEGTRLGRQELQGEVLDDNPNALFHQTDIELARVPVTRILELLLDMDRIVVAIDPAASSNENSDETGIVVAGIRYEAHDDRNHGYVFDDVSGIFTPNGWAKAGVAAYVKYKADKIVGESNNGGEMVEATILSVDSDVPVKLVHASRGKTIRAEPIASFYEQGRIHHVGVLSKLEDQMCSWEPTDNTSRQKSPDRMDALVWALTDLMVGAGETGVLDYMRQVKREHDAAKDMAQRKENKEALTGATNLLAALRNEDDDDGTEEDSD